MSIACAPADEPSAEYAVIQVGARFTVIDPDGAQCIATERPWSFADADRAKFGLALGYACPAQFEWTGIVIEEPA